MAIDEGFRALGLLTRIGGESATFARLGDSEQERWWREGLPEALSAVERSGGRTLGLWRSTWASDWHYYLAHEFPDLATLEAGIEQLRTAGFFRYLTTSRLFGPRWGGEPGWDADKWATSQSHAPFGGVLYYRISESLYTLSAEEISRRHDARRAQLNEAVAGVLAGGGQRLGSYFCEWTSPWHLYVVYEFASLADVAAFNAALPERHGYLDYDLDFLLGKRLASFDEIVRP